MKHEEIAHLATLARIKLGDTEADDLAEDVTSILGYVSEINTIAAEAPAKTVGAVHNVMRDDEHPHEAGAYTEDLLAEAPDRTGQYVRVKKILGSEEN